MSRRRKHAGHTPAHATVAPGAHAARIVGVDTLRGIAICAMIAYHFSFDLNWFGVFRADFNRDALWLSLRASIVTAFLLLVGVSLVLAQRARISTHRYWRRIALIAACALLVTVGSYFIFPRTFITFGILHCIAVASILTWPLVRFPVVALLAGIVVIVVGTQVQLAMFDAPGLNWVGLMTHKPATEDYVPLFPWVGVVCVGIAAGAWLDAREFRPMQGIALRAPAWLNWLGRHSLVVYMVHQPLLIGLLRVLLP